MFVTKRSEMEETKCLQVLRNRMKEDDGLKHSVSFFPDRFLLHFIRGRKYNDEAAFNTLKNFMQLRTHKYRDFFKTVIPSQLKAKDNLFLPLKNIGPNGEYIVVSRVCWWYNSNYDHTLTFDDILAKVVLIGEEICKNEIAQFNGVSVIVDFRGFSLKLARMIGSPTNLMKLFNILYQAIPLKYVELHYLHTPLSIKIIHNFAKTFVPEKLIRRIHIHNETLGNHLPSEILPQSIGGQLREEDAFDFDLEDRILQQDEYYRQFIEKFCAEAAE